MIPHSKYRTVAIWLTLLGFVMASGATRRSGGCCIPLGVLPPPNATVATDEAPAAISLNTSIDSIE